MPHSPLNSRELLERLQAGDGRAATEIFERYVERLVALAQSRIGSKLQRRVDGEDVAQSTFRSFFVHAANNEYALARSGDLWRLLSCIATNKLRGQIEHQTAAKRAIAREDAAGGALVNEATLADQPTPEELLATIEQWELATDRLPDLEQAVLAARLRGESIETMAATLGKSPRTIRRALASARQAIEAALLDALPDNGDAPAPLADMLSAVAGEGVLQLAYADFTLERLLGAGGMGKVYGAVQRSTGRTVAVKALHKARQSDRRAVKKFVEEAAILARLDHPGIVRFDGIGRFPGGGFFLVLEYVEGVDLQTRLERGPLEVEEAVRTVAAVADAVGYAHAQGIVHGDVKPANVLVARNGRVVVTDFGLAQFVADRNGRAGRSRIIGGTEGYLAPEVRLGEMPTVASDVFSLGALLRTLLAGGEAGWLAVGDVVARCLAEDAGERFSSAGEVARTLRAKPQADVSVCGVGGGVP
jgi:DNA-directed RNA polymerase specialized sigma24 family protein